MQNKKNIFEAYNIIKPIFKSKLNDLKYLISIEYKNIQHIKHTNYSDNYMFNDRISEKFYNALGMSKTDFKNIIDNNIDKNKFKNYRMSDPNNMLFQFLMRYGYEINNEILVLTSYEIYGYKLFYSDFVKYFRYGIDESKFKMFTSTLSNKFYLGKPNINTIYDAIDEIMRINLNTYKKDIQGNNEKLFLDFPEAIRTRINNFLNKTYNEYSQFLKKKTLFLNASIDIENKEDESSFNTQTLNDNSESNNFKNQLELLLIQSSDLNHHILDSIINYNIFKHKNCKVDKDFVYNIYHKIIKNNSFHKRIAEVFIENKPEGISISNKLKILSYWLSLTNTRTNNSINELDSLIFKAIPEYETLDKTVLYDVRKILLFLIFEYYKKIK